MLQKLQKQRGKWKKRLQEEGRLRLEYRKEAYTSDRRATEIAIREVRLQQSLFDLQQNRKKKEQLFVQTLDVLRSNCNIITNKKNDEEILLDEQYEALRRYKAVRKYLSGLGHLNKRENRLRWEIEGEQVAVFHIILEQFDALKKKLTHNQRLPKKRLKTLSSSLAASQRQQLFTEEKMARKHLLKRYAIDNDIHTARLQDLCLIASTTLPVLRYITKRIIID